MPKYEVGRGVFALGVLAIVVVAILALVGLGAKDLAEMIINGIFKLHAGPGMEAITS